MVFACRLHRSALIQLLFYLFLFFVVQDVVKYEPLSVNVRPLIGFVEVCTSCGQDYPEHAAGSLLPHTRRGLQRAASAQISPTMRDGLGVVGFVAGGTIGAYYTFEAIMPRIARMLPGRGILQLWLGVPLTGIAAAAAAGFGYGAFPLTLLAGNRAYQAAARGVEGLGRDLGIDDPSARKPDA